MRSVFIVFGLIYSFAPAAQTCSPFLVTNPSEVGRSLTDVVTEVRRLTSPTVALSLLAAHPDHEAWRALRQSSLTSNEWRRTVELAVVRTLPRHLDVTVDYDVVLNQLFASVRGFALPGRRGPSTWFGRWRKLPAGAWPAVDAAVEDELIRQAFKARPEVDLRTVSGALATVQSEARFARTFDATLRALFANFAAHTAPPADFDGWVATIENTLRRDFPRADLATRTFVTSVLEQRFLDVPDLPATKYVVASILESRAGEAPLVPGLGLADRIVPTPPVRIPRSRETEVGATSAPAERRATALRLDVHAYADKEISKLPPHLRDRYDRFVTTIQAPDGFREIAAHPGRWNLERLPQFGDYAYSVRLDIGYRVLFDVIGDLVTVRRVNKGQIHGY